MSYNPVAKIMDVINDLSHDQAQAFQKNLRLTQGIVTEVEEPYRPLERQRNAIVSSLKAFEQVAEASDGLDDRIQAFEENIQQELEQVTETYRHEHPKFVALLEQQETIENKLKTIQDQESLEVQGKRSLADITRILQRSGKSHNDSGVIVAEIRDLLLKNNTEAAKQKALEPWQAKFTNFGGLLAPKQELKTEMETAIDKSIDLYKQLSGLKNPTETQDELKQQKQNLLSQIQAHETALNQQHNQKANELNREHPQNNIGQYLARLLKEIENNDGEFPENLTVLMTDEQRDLIEFLERGQENFGDRYDSNAFGGRGQYRPNPSSDLMQGAALTEAQKGQLDLLENAGFLNIEEIGFQYIPVFNPERTELTYRDSRSIKELATAAQIMEGLCTGEISEDQMQAAYATGDDRVDSETAKLQFFTTNQRHYAGILLTDEITPELQERYNQGKQTVQSLKQALDTAQSTLKAEEASVQDPTGVVSNFTFKQLGR